MSSETIVLQGTTKFPISPLPHGARVPVALRWQQKLRDIASMGHVEESVVLVPMEGCLAIMPKLHYRMLLRAVGDGLLDGPFPQSEFNLEFLLGTKPDLTAFSQDPLCTAALAAAQADLDRHILSRRGFTPAGGRAFEMVIKSVLQAYGFTVEANVMTVAGEVDLLLTSVRGQATSSVIIECKRRRTKVTLSQVARLHGVRSALNLSMDVPQAYVVAVSPSTVNAMTFCDLVDISFVHAKELTSWIESTDSLDRYRSQSSHWTSGVSEGFFQLPSLIANNFKSGKGVMVGLGNYLELWDSREWDQHIAEVLPLTPPPDLDPATSPAPRGR